MTMGPCETRPYYDIECDGEHWKVVCRPHTVAGQLKLIEAEAIAQALNERDK